MRCWSRLTRKPWSRAASCTMGHPWRRVVDMRVRGLASAIWTVFVMLGVSCSVSLAAEDCPASVVTFATHFHVSYAHIMSSAFDTTLVSSSGDTTRMGLDRHAAHMSLNALGGVWAGQRVLERFDVTGVPIGSVVQATVVLTLAGQVFSAGGVGGGDANFTATLSAQADSVLLDATVPGPCYGCTKPVDTTLALPVTITAGSPIEVAFDLLYHDTPAGYGSANVVGDYGVTGLPPGVRAVNCSTTDVTPVRHVSWGRIKAAYR